MSTSKSWGVNRCNAWCSSPVYMLLQYICWCLVRVKTQCTPPTLTQLNCGVESRWRCVLSCQQLAAVLTSLNKFANNKVEFCCVGGVNAPVGSRDPVYNSAAIAYGCRIVNWVTTADRCVHTADTTQLGRINSQHVQFPNFRPNTSAVVVS